MRNITSEEKFWQGEFGNEYISRNGGSDVLAAKVTAFTRYLEFASDINSTLELGGNIGMNEKALSIIMPHISMDVVEINAQAAKECETIPNVTVYQQSIFDFETEKQYDLTFTSGVLIHINPEMLPVVYEKLYKYSSRYILVSEYYNPTPVDVVYHGNRGKLYKRDFAGEMLDRYKDLTLIDYGFIYHRAISHPVEDDLTYFLMQKN